MRIAPLILYILGAGVLIVGGASAQPRGLLDSSRMRALVVNPAVQEALDLTDDQKETIRTESKSMFAALRDIPREERGEKFRQLSEKFEKSVRDVLDEEQQDRLKQIALQRTGLIAFKHDQEIRDALKLNDQQQEKITEIYEKLRVDTESLFEGGYTRESIEKAITLHSEAQNQGLKALTPEQQAEWERLTGKPFEFRVPSRRDE